MPKFTIGQPVSSAQPEVEVEVTPASPLPPGNHRFQLVVIDDSGQESEPSFVDVVVIDEAKPTAVVDGPGRVAAGTSFSLSGRRSSDIPPGRIVQYRWLQIS